VGRKGQSETYLEIDLAVVDDRYAPLLPLIFSAEALAPSGSTEQLLRESARYAVDLGKRLRSRVYEEVVPRLSVFIAQALRSQGTLLDQSGLDLAYSATLRVLFRLLFQAYAEDRGLLPYAKNDTYDRHALKTIANELLANSEEIGQLDTSGSYWRELSLAWEVIDKGDHSWGIPAYNGGLFSSVDPEGDLLASISIPNATLLPCLRSLLLDASDDGTLGPVDFRSLSVREFGTIYEGLLESSLSLALTDLTLDRSGSWVQAHAGDEVEAYANEPYFHSASGERKATGSFFTPTLLVDHLIEQSLVPALRHHLANIEELLARGDEPEAASRFFDFRICDLAMGSGHFLISAIDHAEAEMSAFLEMHPIPQITKELLDLQRVAIESLGDLAADTEIEPTSLLRRQIARRCIYGLDINRIAVELARVAIWIHTFVPGLAMSSLEHGLVHGNSLTGIGTIEEALAELDPPTDKGPQSQSFLRQEIEAELAEASALLRDAASAAEASAKDVARASRLLEEARAKTAPTKLLFDAAILVRIGKLARLRGTHPGDALAHHASDPEIVDTLETIRPAHMPYLFPEVFMRDNGGFDILIGNPPWEKIKVEEHGWWGLYIPGLRSRSMPKMEKDRAVAAAKEARPDLVVAFASDVKAKDFMRLVVSKGPYPGIGSGDIDLSQAFAWRNYQLLRSGGSAGIVLPRSVLAGSGTIKWREEVLDHAKLAQLTLLINSRYWIFPVHPQYNIGLVVVSRASSDEVILKGPFTSYERFAAGRDQSVRIKTSVFKSWSSTYAFPRLPSEASVDVFLQLRSHPRLDSDDGFEFRPVAELHTTADKRFYDFDLKDPKGDVRVLGGKSFEIWNPDFGQPYAYAYSDQVIPYLEGKLRNQRNNRRSAFYGLTDEQLTPRPWERARIAFRDVARSNDTRTTKVALIPPGSLLVHKAPYLLRQQGTALDEAYLLGVLSSIPFDWYARRYVELDLTFELLNPMPVPRPVADDPLRLRVIEIAGRLAAVDDRFGAWATAVRVPVGSVTDQEEKDDMICELDALVALLYGLSEAQFRHVFETFHVGWNYEARLAVSLKHFEYWGTRL
jgi:hypothetical protein